MRRYGARLLAERPLERRFRFGTLARPTAERMRAIAVAALE
jgi:hypothetical protein